MTFQPDPLLQLIPIFMVLGFVWVAIMVFVLGLYKRTRPLFVIGPHNSGEVLRSTLFWHLVRWHGSNDEGWVHKLDVKKAPAGLFEATP